MDDEPGRDEAMRLVSCITEIIVPSIVVHELVWSTRRSHGAARAQSLAAYVLSEKVFVYEPILVDDVWFALRDPRRYEDLLVLHVAMRLGVPLVTLDKRLAKLAHKYGIETHIC